MRALRFFLSRWQNWLGLFIVLAFTVTALAVDQGCEHASQGVGRVCDAAAENAGMQVAFGARKP